MLECIIYYLILSSFLSLVIGLIYAKIYSPFWFHQPVYHIYEIFPYFRLSNEPYLKQIHLPRRGVFYTPNPIETTAVHDTDLTLFISLLQGHYLDNTTHLLNVTKSNFMKIHSDGSSLISGYYENRMIPPTFHSVMDKTHVYGMITSRPIQLSFLDYPSKNILAHYLDYICVHEKYRAKNISRNLIQTHIYNHRHQNPTFSGVYIFKKDIESCKAVVPLVSTTNYTFILHSTPINKLPLHFSVRRLAKKHIHVWRGIYSKIMETFKVCVLPDFVSTLDWLADDSRYYIYMAVFKTKHAEDILSVYIFENTDVSWEYSETQTKPNMLRLTASLVVGNQSDELYYFRGFLHSLKDILRNAKEFGILEIPNVSHNQIILERWREKYELRNETLLYYYLYNMVYPRSPLFNRDFICIT